jgi:hypothetical protein
MRLAPIVNPHPDLKVFCERCRASVLARSAFAVIDAPAFTYRCLSHAVEQGTFLVLSVPVEMCDLNTLRTASRVLYAKQGGNAVDADISWSLEEALFECAINSEMTSKTGAGIRFHSARAALGLFAENDGRVDWLTAIAGRPVQLDILLRVVDIDLFHTALEDFGPTTAFGDPAEYLGRALRAWVAADCPPIDFGVEIVHHRATALPFRSRTRTLASPSAGADTVGYDIEQRTTRFHIAAEHVARAYRLAATLCSPDTLADGGVWQGGKMTARWFAFVNPVELEAADDLVSFLTAFRWTPTVEADGSISHIRFTGSRLDQSGLLFETIAPCVSVGCFVEMFAEDEAEWRWVFTGDVCRVDVITPTQWGPSWLQSVDPSACNGAETPTEDVPREPWAADSEAWRA